MDTHYYTLKIPERFFNDEVKLTLLKEFGYNPASSEDMKTFLEHVDILDGVATYEDDSSVEHSGPVDAMYRLNVPAFATRGGSYEYDECCFISYPKGYPGYDKTTAVELYLDKNSQSVIEAKLVADELAAIIGRLDQTGNYKAFEDDIRRMKTETDMVVNPTRLEEELMQYYKFETEFGRSAIMSKKISLILEELDAGTIDDKTAMAKIKAIQEGETNDV